MPYAAEAPKHIRLAFWGFNLGLVLFLRVLREQELLRNVDRPRGSQEGASLLLRRQGGFYRTLSFILYFAVFQSLGGHASARRVSHKPCFRQAHCFVQGPLRFLLVPPNPTCALSHVWGFPKVTNKLNFSWPRIEEPAQ